MIKRTFDPGFRIALHQKDLNLALAARARSAWRCRRRPSAAQLMQACAANGVQDLRPFGAWCGRSS